jgi:hypothetical protein
VPTSTVTQAVLAVHGVTASDMEAPELAPEVALGLRAELEENGFDLTAPIHVQELAVQPRLSPDAVGRFNAIGLGEQ